MSNANQLKREFLKLYWPSVKLLTQFILILVTLILVLYYKALFIENSALLGGAERDAGFYLWLMRSNIADFFSLPWFDTKSFYPYGKTLAWSDNFILPSLIAGQLQVLGLREALSYNMLLLGAIFLNGLTVYILCFALSGEHYGALFSGITIVVWHYLVGMLGHPQLQFAFFIPLGILLFFTLLTKPTVTRSFFLSLTVTLTFLTTVYYAIFLALCCVLLLIGTLLVKPKMIKELPWLKLGAGALLGFIPIIPFLLPYLHTREAFGERALHEAYYFSSDLLSYLSASPHNIVYKATAELSHSEAHLFPGIIVILLVLIGLWRVTSAPELKRLREIFLTIFVLSLTLSYPALSEPFFKYLTAISLWLLIALFGMILYRLGSLERKLGSQIFTNRDIVAVTLFTAVMLFTLSFGPLGYPEIKVMSLSPYRLLYELMPGFNSMRAISRIIVPCYTLLLLAAAFTLTQLLKDSRIKPSAAVVIILFSILEQITLTFPLELIPEAPAVYRSIPLEKIPSAPTVYRFADGLLTSQDAVISLPFAGELDQYGQVKRWSEFARLQVNYMNWSATIGRPTVNGYSGQRSKLIKELPRELANFPDRRSIQALSQIAGLRYIFFISKNLPYFDRVKFEVALKESSAWLSIVNQDENNNYLLQLRPEAVLDERFTLIAPQSTNGKLEIQIVSRGCSPESSLEVFADDSSTPLTTIPCSAASTSTTTEIFLSKISKTVRPIRLTFRALGGANFIMTDSKYSRSL